jgi:CDP-glycerol glycerophosphotransferase (TagB/SpsB family)
MAEVMLSIAKSYSDKIQFAFKPHPRLFTELCGHPDWGEDRARQYYQEWQDMENTQVETGEFVDLFMTSDAMIHDCSSFCCEYLFTGKPVLFMMRDEERQVSLLNEMSHAALYAHYIGRSPDAPEQFLRKQVSEGFDPKKDERARVATSYLIPPNGKSAAENIIAAILDQLPE